jgi:hypothetical protein
MFVHVMAIGGDPQYKMENVLDHEGTGDKPMTTTQPNPTLLYFRNPVVSFIRLETALQALVANLYQLRWLQR